MLADKGSITRTGTTRRTGSDELRKCLVCGDIFAITPDVRSWFDQRGLRLPRRCKPCRDAGKFRREW